MRDRCGRRRSCRRSRRRRKRRRGRRRHRARGLSGGDARAGILSAGCTIGDGGERSEPSSGTATPSLRERHLSPLQSIVGVDACAKLVGMSVNKRAGQGATGSRSSESTGRSKRSGSSTKTATSSRRSVAAAAARGEDKRIGSSPKSDITRTTRKADYRPRAGIDELVESLATRLQELGQDMDGIRALLAERATAPDPFRAVAESFARELRSLLGHTLPDEKAVRRAARLAVADQAWEQGLGGLWETKDVVATLGVSRQRVSVLARAHDLIALVDEGRLRFPVWQFAGTDREDRSTLAAAHRLLVEDGAVNPWSAASWFITDHPDLDGLAPVSWVQSNGDHRRLLTAAERDAARAAQ